MDIFLWFNPIIVCIRNSIQMYEYCLGLRWGATAVGPVHYLSRSRLIFGQYTCFFGSILSWYVLGIADE
jgi:hypothetical protein